MGDLQSYSRWAAWEQAVLARVNNPEKCQELIKQRQQAVDDDATEAELVADEFRSEIRNRGHNPDTDCVFITSKIAAAWLKAGTGQHRATNYASKYLKMLKLQELQGSKKNGITGWCWRGLQAEPGATMKWLEGTSPL